MKHSLLGGLLALWLPCLSFTSDAPAHQKPADEIIERASIRARGRSHGEVRLVRRGPALVLQTLLVTRNLARVATQIRDNEATNWPEDSWGHAESRRYRDALDREVASVLAREQSDRNRRLLIELRLLPKVGTVAFAAPETRSEAGALRILSIEELSNLASSCRWVRRQIELVAADRGLSLAAARPPSC
jgi:hypothetical protein